MENFIFCVVLLSDMELLKKMFYTISDMGKTNRAQFFLFRNIAKNRMAPFNIYVTVKCHRGNKYCDSR